MKKYFAVLVATLMLAFGGLAVQATVQPSSASAQLTAPCYWSRDGYWHYSPGYDVWYQFAGYATPYEWHGVVFSIYEHGWSHYAGQWTTYGCW